MTKATPTRNIPRRKNRREFAKRPSSSGVAEKPAAWPASVHQVRFTERPRVARRAQRFMRRRLTTIPSFLPRCRAGASSVASSAQRQDHYRRLHEEAKGDGSHINQTGDARSPAWASSPVALIAQMRRGSYHVRQHARQARNNRRGERRERTLPGPLHGRKRRRT